MEQRLLEILCCPQCGGKLREMREDVKCRTCTISYHKVDGIPVLFAEGVSEGDDFRISREKWGDLWKTLDWEDDRINYERANLPYICRYLDPLPRGGWFLEIGGGPSFLSFEIAYRGMNVISVDFDLEVLRAAKTHFRKHGRTGDFVCANVNRLPFRDGVFDVSAGIGVLEHSRNIEMSVRELARVGRRGGYTFQTVPHASLTTLINGSLRYGTVPPIPVLRGVVWLIHRRLLGMKYMRYGYEESYTYRSLRKAFRAAEFSEVDVGFYDYNQTLLREHVFAERLLYKMIRIRVLGLMPFGDIAYIKAWR